MLNIDKVKTVYLACGITDLRKSIDGLTMIVENELKLDPFNNVLFVFCNKQMNKLKILHFDEGFWLYYYQLETNKEVVKYIPAKLYIEEHVTYTCA